MAPLEEEMNKRIRDALDEEMCAAMTSCGSSIPTMQTKSIEHSFEVLRQSQKDLDALELRLPKYHERLAAIRRCLDVGSWIPQAVRLLCIIQIVTAPDNLLDETIAVIDQQLKQHGEAPWRRVYDEEQAHE